MSTSSYTITLIPGDGIGPEVTAATVRVLEATGVPIHWEVQEAGAVAMEKYGTPLPEQVLESVRKNGVALKGPITTPVGRGFKSVNVQLRRALDLYANVRPAQSLPGIPTPFKDVDLIIFRENTEGLYLGIEWYDEKNGVAEAVSRITRLGSERIARFCFEYARSHGRRKVTAAHKANILKITSGLFLRVCQEVSRDYPDVAFEDRIIDNMSMQLVMRPHEYDCIVTTNLFGDILSDLAAGLVGGLGVIPGANIGDSCAVFEAVHGSAPDIAGQNKANPTALIRSGEMMLRYLGEHEAADIIREALMEQYAEGRCLTADVGGTAATTEFTECLVARIKARVSA